MSQFQFFSRLNSSERRFVVVVAMVIFVGVNWFWVRPHFSDLTDYRRRLETANRDYERRQTIIQEGNRLAPEIAVLLREGGGSVLPEDQSIHFFRTIQSQATQSGVNLVSNSRLITSTNDPFFTEQVQNIMVTSGEKQLVDFLYNLGQGNSQIRVRALSVRPDTPRQQLNANITLVAAYKREEKRVSTAAPGGTRPTVPAIKPTTQPAGTPTPQPTAPTVKTNMTRPTGPITRTLPPVATPTNRAVLPKPTPIKK